MTIESGILEMLGAAIVSAVGTIGAFYQVFVPRDEARAYRAGVAESIDNIKDSGRKTDRKIEGIEIHLSKALTRTTLDDVIDPVKADLAEIKLILRRRGRDTESVVE